MPNLPSTTALRCLDASARLLSFTKAAHEVNLTQSAVSHHIQSLERELGIVLFERDRSGLRLTAGGQRYWEDTATVLHQLQRAAKRAVATDDAAMPLTITVASSFANFWLMPRLGDFIAANPDIILSLSNVVDRPDAFPGHEDAAIQLCEADAPGLESRQVLSLLYQAYASSGLLERFGIEATTQLDLSGREALITLLASCPLIRTSMPGAWKAWLREAGIDSHIPASHIERSPVYAQASMALTAAMTGTGVALLPRYIAQHAIANHQLVRLSRIGWRADRAYYLRWPSHRPPSEALRRFERWIVAQAEREQSDDSDSGGVR